MKKKPEIAAYIAELIGTFFMVFFGCGSMILAEVNSQYDPSWIPVIWGGSVLTMIYAVGHISGAHFNPAVTLAFWSVNRFQGKHVIGYLIAQISGALFASWTHWIIWGSTHHFGATQLSLSVSGGIVVEVILSFALMFVIISVATDSKAVGDFAGVAIGSTVALCAFVGGPLTNASMNPARSLAPAFMSGQWTHLWIYILFPLVGTFLGARVYEWIREKEPDKDSIDH
jgi:aquaporin NIP